MVRIIFRVDASDKIGRGHLDRCLMIAKQFNYPDKIYFYMSQTQSKYEKMVLNNGFKLQKLISDNKEEVKFLDGSILIIDHYDIGIEWEAKFKSIVYYLVVVTDFPSKEHECNLLIDGNPLRKKEEYNDKVNKSCKVLTGNRYCFINNDFINFKRKIENTKTDVSKIHIYFGSQDKNNLTYYFSRKILEYTDYNIVIVVSYAYQYESSLNMLLERFKSRVEVFFQPLNMAETFRGVKYALGAPGLATWERMYLEIPSFFITTNINQIEILKNIHNLYLGVYLGHFQIVKTTTVISYLLEYLNNEKKIIEIKKRISGFIDGKGVERIVKEVLKNVRYNSGPL